MVAEYRPDVIHVLLDERTRQSSFIRSLGHVFGRMSGVRCLVFENVGEQAPLRELLRHVECVVGIGGGGDDSRFRGTFYKALSDGLSIRNALDVALLDDQLRAGPEKRIAFVESMVNPETILLDGHEPATQSEPPRVLDVGDLIRSFRHALNVSNIVYVLIAMSVTGVAIRASSRAAWLPLLFLVLVIVGVVLTQMGTSQLTRSTGDEP